MSTPADTRTEPRAHRGIGHHLAPRVAGAALALGVAYVHVQDQGGLPGEKYPSYVGLGYYALELAGLVVAVALLLGAGRHTLKVWFVAAGVALGPILGFVLSRGPGLPNYSDDKGNWTEELAMVSLMVEALLLVVAVVILTRPRRATLR